MKKMLFVMFVCLVGFGFATLPGTGFDNMTCGEINVSGTYKVNSTSIFNITSNTGVSCINITISHVILNLNSTTINGALGTYEAAIYIYNKTGTGQLTNITIANGTINNSYYGILVGPLTGGEVQNVTITNVTVYNISNIGIYIVSSNINVTASTIYNMDSQGIRIHTVNAYNVTISDNTLYNSTQSNIQIFNSNYNNIFSNVFYDNEGSDSIQIDLIGSMGCNVTNNTISNLSSAGVSAVALYYSNLTIFSGNTILNSTLGILLSQDSILTFSGNNIINLTPAGRFIVNISNGSLSTNGYNITTEYLPFALATTYNVSIQVVNFSAISGLTTVSSISGISITGAKVVQSLWGNYYGLNVTSENSGANIAPKMYYNTSDVGSPYSTSYLGIGKTSSGSSWSYYSSTVTSADSSLNTSGITSFSYLIPIVYYYTAPVAVGGSSDNPILITPTTSFDCKTGILTVTLSSKVNGGTVKLLDKTNFQNPVTAKVEDGKAVFTILKSGTYKLVEGSFSSGYDLNDETETYTLCPGEPVECTTNTDCSSTEKCTANECVAVTGTCGYATSHAWVSYECCADSDCTADMVCTDHVCEETGGVPDFIDEIIEQAAVDAINEATSAIETAKGAGKDTVDAEAKLAEAQAAYDSGDPDLAESLARESIELIKEPQAEESEEETPEETLDETTTEDSKEDKGADYSMVLYLVGAVIVLFLLYKFVLKGGKGYRK